jgi:hypothetical protein
MGAGQQSSPGCLPQGDRGQLPPKLQKLLLRDWLHNMWRNIAPNIKTKTEASTLWYITAPLHKIASLATGLIEKPAAGSRACAPARAFRDLSSLC